MGIVPAQEEIIRNGSQKGRLQMQPPHFDWDY